MRVRVLRVLLLLLLLLLLFVHAGVCCVAIVWMCEVWFSSCPGAASFTAVGIPRWPEPKSPYSHFPPAPTSSGRGIFAVFLRQAGQTD